MDDIPDVVVQVGRRDQPLVVPDSTLTSKYRSVIVRGFRTDTSIESVLEIMSQEGLPTDHSADNVVKNEQTGSLTIENLQPEACLLLIENMNRKRFLNRQVYVTSVVAGSPAKSAVQDQQQVNSGVAAPLLPPQFPSPEDQVPPNLGNLLVLRPPQSSNSLLSNTSSGSSKSPVQEKISQLEKQSSALDASGDSRTEKRKSEESPETSEISRKEKKLMREMEKKRKKLEFKQKNKVELQHSF